MKYGDLPENASAQGLMLYCSACDCPYAADRGDYFLRDPNEEATCGYDDEILLLARRIPEHFEPLEHVPA